MEDKTSHDMELHKDLTLWTDESPPTIEREDILDFGDHAFLLHGVLSEAECKHYIDECNSAGFDSLGGYRANYRNNLRIVSRSEALAALIFERVRPFLEEEITVTRENTQRVNDTALGIEGRWRVSGCNPSFRFCKYLDGGHFAPHTDGAFVPRQDRRSLITLNFYLNSEFSGGETRFLRDQPLLMNPDTGLYQGDDNGVLYAVRPRSGSVLVFHHCILHEGTRVVGGEKYIMRTDVMYDLVESTPMSQEDMDAYVLICQAEEAEVDGDGARAASLYKTAFKKSRRVALEYGQA